MTRGPMGSRWGGPAARTVAPRSFAGAAAATGLFGHLERLCAVMPPRLKMEIAERIEEWAREQRRIAMQQLGLSDAPPDPRDSRETFNTDGEPRRW